MNNFLSKNKSKKIVVLDIPLLMENKINKRNDILIFVDAKKKEIKKRLNKKKNLRIIKGIPSDKIVSENIAKV